MNVINILLTAQLAVLQNSNVLLKVTLPTLNDSHCTQQFMCVNFLLRYFHFAIYMCVANESLFQMF